MNRQYRLRLAQIHQIIPTFHPENDAVDQISLSRGIFLLNRLPFSLPDLLKYYLLGGLRGNPSQIAHLDDRPNLVADLCLAVELASFLKRDFGFWIGDRINDGLLRHDGDLTGLGVDLDLNILSLPETLLGSHLKGRLNRSNHSALLDALLPAKFIND